MYNTNSDTATTAAAAAAMQFQQTHRYVFSQQPPQAQYGQHAPHNVSMNDNGFPSPVTIQDDTPPTKAFYHRYPQEQQQQQQQHSHPHQLQQQYTVSVSEPIDIDFASNDHQDSASDSVGFLSPTMSPTSMEDEVLQRNMQQILDKKRRRRESHNAVERRRRDNINDRINELATLLPDRDASKLSKGSILRSSVDHIKLLHDNLRQHQRRIQELESLLEMYRITSQQ